VFLRGFNPNSEIQPTPACRAAWEYGLDLSLLEETLRMTQHERLLATQRARQQVLLLNPNWLDPPRPDEIGFPEHALIPHKA
jgi:hypothetical protein